MEIWVKIGYCCSWCLKNKIAHVFSANDHHFKSALKLLFFSKDSAAIAVKWGLQTKALSFSIKEKKMHRKYFFVFIKFTFSLKFFI